MSQVKFFKVATLPGVLEGDCFYYVANGSYAESYLTDSSGTAKSLGNTAMITAVVAQAIAALPAGNATDIVANIAARNSLTASATANKMILVVDASADTSVNSGSALYAYNFATETTYKVAEYESMDVVLEWTAIVGRPSSSAAQIDSAVTASHSHGNIAVLNQITADADGLLYNGAGVGSRWGTTNW